MKCVLSAAVLVLSVVSCWAADPTQGLGCKTEAGFTYCDGKSPSYTDQAGQAEGKSPGGLETRSRGGNPLLTKQYGMYQPSPCDRAFGGKCQQVAVNSFPTYLLNNRNQPRYILQTPSFKQPIQLAICSGKGCGPNGVCDQVYVNVQLVAWNPLDKIPNLILDNFKIPSCCQCKRAGRGPF